MAITQLRMLALIDAALDYQRAIQRAEKFVSDAWFNVRQQNADPTEELSTLMTLIQELGLLSKPKESPIIIQLEQRHFRKTASANERRMAHLRRKRGYKGTTTAPDSLIHMGSVQDERSRIGQLRTALLERQSLVTSVTNNLSAEDKSRIDQEAAQIEDEIAKEEAFLLEQKARDSKSLFLYDPDDTDPAGPIIASPDTSEE